MSQTGRRHRQRWAVALAGTLGLAVMSSCGGSSSAASDATVVEVKLGRFTIEPAVLEVPAGDVELKVTNVDPDMAHNLVVYSKGTKTLAPGDSQTLEIPGVAVGEYRMWCDVQGHAAMGQVGSFVVVPAPSPTPTT